MKNQKTFVVVIYFAILAVTIAIAGLLFSQYRYFKQEAQELQQVKEAYYQHVEMLKRSLNASMVHDEEEDQDSEAEKKKITNDQIGSESLVTVDFTLDAEQEETTTEFAIISQEEEDLLNAIKAQTKKLCKKPVVKHKKIPKKAFYKSLKKPTRYAPQRDFVFRWPVELSNFW
ncbi:MAG TPA: hypothetical protein VLG50_04155, partial [Candidatus Saccharimonadales bacterium]|nr:hypothetical protein [Candidatus Saccharimonadales bacterium]